MSEETTARIGFTVRQLIEELKKVPDQDRHVAIPEMGFGGLSKCGRVEEMTLSGFSGRYSFEDTDVVLLSE